MNKAPKRDERRLGGSKPMVGFEPTTTGLQNRSCGIVNREGAYAYSQQDQPLTPQLTPESQKQGQIEPTPLPPDLAEIVAVWPQLPEHIQAAIITLVRAHG
ncbi:MAG: hypothetical protein A2Y76_04920 [Planctomycetes bacterium RBG_13_60_9]|nr:MAG: hypothetical protein A2Y76_04920 [Planctomycetes bacterium RBG_13_60_9]